MSELVLLARGDSPRSAAERLRASLARFGEVGGGWDRVRVVCGELGGFELESELLGRITHVLHCAGCTSFRSRREVHRTNVAGSFALAERFRLAPRLQRFLHVSTAFQCGRVSEKYVSEDTAPAADHVVEYTRSKAAAEDALGGLAFLPLVIARPSAVIGHTTRGVGPSTSLYWYYRALASAGVAPFPEGRHRDIVSVDYVAAALTHLLFGRLAHRCYNVSAGESAANTWGQLREAFGAPVPSRYVPPAELAPHPAWDRIGGGDARLREALALVARFATLPIEWFSNQRLLDSGFPAPQPFSAWLPRCLETSNSTVLEMITDDA